MLMFWTNVPAKHRLDAAGGAVDEHGGELDDFLREDPPVFHARRLEVHHHEEVEILHLPLPTRRHDRCHVRSRESRSGKLGIEN
uniref:Uncharacterized protein n=1 Tax=Triticum urartu TaxID=4572 RepID=A0A8R7TTN9_TRIUA